jgi:hypothetical protein
MPLMADVPQELETYRLSSIAIFPAKSMGEML